MVRVVVPCTEAEAAPVRALAVRVYEEAKVRAWPFLSDVLEGALRGVAEEDRGIATGVVQALVKYDRLLGFVTGSERAESRCEALFALARGETDVSPRVERIADATERLGVTYSVPDGLVELVRGEVGDAAAEPILGRMNELPSRVARVNTLRTTREACEEALASEHVEADATKVAAQGLVLGGRRSPFRTQAFARGDFELQDEASQMVAELVAPPPRSYVVDACAGAGGKTLALAAQLGGKGKLVAVDSSEAKLEELRRRARRAGASNVQAMQVDLRDEAAVARLPRDASRVLVDAPCTGLGAIRRNPEARWRWKKEDLARLVAEQAALLTAASTLVAPHGRLVFATCSFLPSEGEVGVEFFLSEHPDFELVTARDVLGRARSAPIATTDGRYLRTWRFDGEADGGDAGMDGFFAAVVRRRRDASSRSAEARPEPRR